LEESSIKGKGEKMDIKGRDVDGHPRVSIIILNWNGWKDTIECLESLYQITYPNYDVIVVDNGSKDDSIERIKEYAEGKAKVESKFFEYSDKNKPIKYIEYTREEAEAGGRGEKEIADLSSNKKLIFIKNEKNYGFAEGNNIGMRYALNALNPDYVLLLNNDTVVDKEFLGELVKVGERDEMIGIVGPKIYYYDYAGKTDVIWFAGSSSTWNKAKTIHIGLRETDKGQYNKLNEATFITGCALLVKREVIKKIGLLDPIYFAYFEDVDWCFRARKAGYKLTYVPNSVIYHKVGSSANKVKDFQLYYRIRNRFILMRRYSSNIHFFVWLIFWFFGLYLTYNITYHILNRDINRLRTILKGTKKGIRMLLTVK
jgi:GT2 family glycosyltransferase